MADDSAVSQNTQTPPSEQPPVAPVDTSVVQPVHPGALTIATKWLTDKGIIGGNAEVDRQIAEKESANQNHPGPMVRFGRKLQDAIMDHAGAKNMPPEVANDLHAVVSLGLGTYGLKTEPDPVVKSGTPFVPGMSLGEAAAGEFLPSITREPAPEPAAPETPKTRTITVEPTKQIGEDPKQLKAVPKELEGLRVQLHPKEIIEGQGLTYKGEVTPGSDVHMFEHPNHPGLTAALAGPLTEDAVREKMGSKLEEFGVKPNEPTHITFEKIGGKEVAPPSEAARQNRTFGQEEAPVTEAPAPEHEATLAARGQLPGQTVNLSSAYGDTGGYVGGLVEHRIPGATPEDQKANYIEQLGPYHGSGLMEIPQHLMPEGSTTHDVITHELAHAVVANLMGLPTEGVEVASHLHPDTSFGAAAMIKLPLDKIPGTVVRGPNRVYFPQPVLEENFPKLMTNYVAGGIAQELLHQIPMETNLGLAGDKKQIAQITRLMGFSEDESAEMLQSAEQKARDILSHPATADLIKQAAGIREPNLSRALHVSANKVQNLIQKIRTARGEEAPNESDITGNKPANAPIVPETQTGGAGAGAEEHLPKTDWQAISSEVEHPEVKKERLAEAIGKTGADPLFADKRASQLIESAEGRGQYTDTERSVSRTLIDHYLGSTAVEPVSKSSKEPEKIPFSGTHYSTLSDQTVLKGSDRGKSAAGSEKDRLQHSNAVPGVYVYREGATAEPQIGSRANKYPVSGDKAIADIGGAQKQMFVDADSVHLRQAAEALGLKGGEGQEQLWGTVLGLKTLLKQGLTAEEAGVKLDSDTIRQIGKDYAEVIANDPEITRPGGLLDRLQQKHGIGRGSAGVSAAYSQASGPSASEGGPGFRQKTVDTSSLGKTANRILGQISSMKIAKPVPKPKSAGIGALDLISALSGLKSPGKK